MKSYLLAIFIRSRRPIALEFNVSRLQEQAALPPDHPHSLHPALMNAIYMLACHYGSGSLSAYEPIFLKRVRISLYQSLSIGDRLFDFVRAYALTGLYYYYKGRLSEGHFHTSAAARFAIGCGLHKITPRNPSILGLLDPPRDNIELGDRIHTFWFLFIVDRGGSLWCGLPQSLTDKEIDTAWPRPVEDYEKGNPWGERYTSVRSFLTDDPRTICGPSDTVFCQRMKGIILMEHAAKLADRAKQVPMSLKLAARIQALRETATYFIDSLPLSPGRFEPVDLWHASLLARTSAHGALMFIDGISAEGSLECRQRRLYSARAVAATVRLMINEDFLHLPLLLGLTWFTAFDALKAEQKRLKRLSMPELKEVEDELDLMLKAMVRLSAFYPTMSLEVQNGSATMILRKPR
ncbi:hypothetical protein BOTBODRAFT_266530 [Botryobasidium botryosum FD-172 SS1]|uniref:Xylanolytic transcriptional activator regulatory domain-containing protein n=1 Tax=Botryobasidium botryosum (strain FD-172 SS1) TaxID=930990 RepID=A0A067MVY0_BOTB1|nr:hypothetical protein BOTBODRAFT_266530 [Botryobasidium botryosum FD-172 SS1]